MTSEELTFRLLDPFKSWGNHELDWWSRSFKKNDFHYDSGFCNRLFTWEAAYHLMVQSNQEKSRTIYVQKRVWPELELISLPNTQVVDYSPNEDMLYSKYEDDLLLHTMVVDSENRIIKIANKLTDKEFSKCEKKGYRLEHTHVYNDWRFHNLGTHNYIKDIKIKDEVMDDFFSRKPYHMIGFHLRRGNGVKFGKKQVETFPKELRMEYLNFRKQDVATDGYPFISDSEYFKLFDSILEINPEQEFFISHDLPDTFMEPYYERYGKNHIRTKADYRDWISKYYESKGVDVVSLQNYCNGLDNVIDLWMVSNTSLFIPSIHSTWSEFAAVYSGKENHGRSFNGKNHQEIIDFYKGFYQKFKHVVTGNDWLSIASKPENEKRISINQSII